MQSRNSLQACLLLLFDVNNLRFFLFLKNPFKLWVCLLLSFSGPYSYSLSRSKKPSLCFSLSRTSCCFKLLQKKQRCSCQHVLCRRARSDIYMTCVALFHAQHKFAATCSCLKWTQAQDNCNWAHLQLCEHGSCVFIHIYWCMFLWIQSCHCIIFFTRQMIIKGNPCLGPLSDFFGGYLYI